MTEKRGNDEKASAGGSGTQDAWSAEVDQIDGPTATPADTEPRDAQEEAAEPSEASGASAADARAAAEARAEAARLEAAAAEEAAARAATRAEEARRAAWERDVERARAEGRDPLSMVAGEARRLLDSLQDRAAREIGRGLLWGTRKSIGQMLGGGAKPERERDVWEDAVSDHHEDGYICRACPVCRVIAAQREAGRASTSAGADIADHLVAAGGELVTALREAVDALARPTPARRPREDRPGQADRDDHGDVEHIDLG
ncbi:hypothetical protein [Spongiactinospora sp. TRM90649]|uniref:hypothetical protein n=1 Tax=Spongiactinospora sp. TRM90649 TaxID=3031114 RepID=UPI0023F768AC|nr:hypothetical protein [Spongiactinospora sp. TRM90649]MDF5758469.1 hypothetical protein [Spongiactinospora sp. TRM90649]